MLRFLEANESLEMQTANRFCYEVAIGRVCTTYALNQPLFPSLHQYSTSCFLALHDLSSSLKSAALNNEVRDALGVAQVGTRLLIMRNVGAMKMSWSLYQTLAKGLKTQKVSERKMVLEDCGPVEFFNKHLIKVRTQSSFSCLGSKQVYMLGG